MRDPAPSSGVLQPGDQFATGPVLTPPQSRGRLCNKVGYDGLW